MTFMTAVHDRVATRPWVAAGAVAFVFVGLHGLWSALVTMSFAISGGGTFGDWSIRSEMLKSEWGTDLTYAGVLAGAGFVLRVAARSGVTFAWWTLLWRSVVLYLPAHVLVVLVLSIGAVVIHGGPLYLFGVRVIS